MCLKKVVFFSFEKLISKRTIKDLRKSNLEVGMSGNIFVLSFKNIEKAQVMVLLISLRHDPIQVMSKANGIFILLSIYSSLKIV